VPGRAKAVSRRWDTVLRLVILDGVMEMRFCGARVQLGPVMT